VNHVAFTVTDMHEVIGGGIAMAQKRLEDGDRPGRHPISSAYFWYFHNPLGAPWSTTPTTTTAPKLEARQFTRAPERFAEWAIAGGIDGTTRRQVVARRQRPWPRVSALMLRRCAA
jgi:hypothetical protein